MKVRKNFKLLEYGHIIYQFEARDLEIPNIYNLFREIFKFREDKSNNVFHEILKCFRKTAKFEYFAKQIIYRVSKKGIDKKLLVGAAHDFNPQFLNLFGFSISVSFVWCII